MLNVCYLGYLVLGNVLLIVVNVYKNKYGYGIEKNN